MTDSNPIQFFDIASGPPVRPYAPNPCKTRYALNYKKVAYKTQWVELPEVESTRRAHKVPPVRKLPNGGDFYTLPFIHDPINDTHIGDTFDIAVYLDEKYPDMGPSLFPRGGIALYRAFNVQVDALFTRFVQLTAHGMPLNPETAEETKQTMLARFGLNSWDDVTVKGEARAKMLKDFEAALEEFACLYKNDDGPFLEGKAVSYADFIVGGWLRMIKETLFEWEEFCTWQGGRWKRLFLALEQWAEIK